jgi:hypothetical protein
MSLHESIGTRFFLRRLGESNVPLSLGDKNALRPSPYCTTEERRQELNALARRLGLAI